MLLLQKAQLQNYITKQRYTRSFLVQKNTQKAILDWDVCSRKIYNKKDKHLLCLLIHYKQHYCIFWTHTLYLWNSILMKLLSVVFAFRWITKGWRFGGVHCVISAMTVGTMQNLPDAEKFLHRYCYHFK